MVIRVHLSTRLISFFYMINGIRSFEIRKAIKHCCLPSDEHGDKNNYEGCISHGPWGGSKGKSWTYKPKGVTKKITVTHSMVINFIKFQSKGRTGEIESGYYGGICGNQKDTICIDYPNEYLTSISGTFGNYFGYVFVKSLCFVTNQKYYGPYGLDVGTPFSYDGKGGVIVGFHGRVSTHLDAIGIYVMPESLAFGRNSTTKDNSMHELCSTSISRMSMPREAGPWGVSGGKPWDDGVFSTVKQVHVHVGESLKVIYSVQFKYVKWDAKVVLSPMHGGTGGDQIESVNLDGTDEYLTGISGFYGPVYGYNGLEAITSITFHTNKMKHGPYGEEIGAGYTYFTSSVSPGKVVGFHGRNYGFLSAIGVHMDYF
ncbi:agglutinin-like [Cynara cardunculus var. scolymus]|uniref:agglutinin-like n=1 Tax=Cynara cardunculus var. scolymus TaxID=59895 RepID=UPI000D62E4BF|nr:agglutinin-like [Cynara cardunculus var. scolymus]